MILNKRLIAFLCGCLAVAGATAQQADTIPPTIKEDSYLHAIALQYDATKARSHGDNAEAEQMLREALKFDPNAAGIYYDLARLSFGRKGYTEAEKNIKKAISLSPENKWYREQYAILLLDQNKFKEAASVYEEILALDEHNKEYMQTIAYLYQRAGEKKKALAAFDKLLKIYGDDEEILEGKMQLYLNENELDKAVEINNKLITIAPSESKYYIRLAEMYNNSNQQDKAAEVYKKAEAVFPDDPGIQLSLSEYYQKKGDAENYKKYLKKVITNNALDAPSQLSILAEYIITVKDTAGRNFGLDMAREIASQSPDDAGAQAGYGDMLGISGKLPEAAAQYKKSLDISPANYAVWKNLLSVYLQEEQADSIVKFSEQALRLFPNQAQLHFLNGVGHNINKDYTKAANSLNRAIDMMPEENRGELSGMYATLGDIYYNAKQYDLSDENFIKAIELSPDNPTTLNNYSYYLSERGIKLDEAEKMSKRSLELAPEQATFMDTYGWIMYKKGNYKKAKEYIEKAIGADEQPSGTLYDHLGDIHYKLNDKDKALEYWQKARDLGADNPFIDKKIADKKLYE